MDWWISKLCPLELILSSEKMEVMSLELQDNL